MEIRAESASAKLRQSNRSDKRIEVTVQLLHSCWTAILFEERLTWRKLLKLLIGQRLSQKIPLMAK